MPETHAGGCLRGAIRFRNDGNPRKATVCHCTLCQRTTGSAFSIELLMQSAVSWVAPPSDAECFSAHMLSEDGSPIQPMRRMPTE